MEQNRSLEPNDSSDSKTFPALCDTRRFYTMLTGARLLSISGGRWIRITFSQTCDL